MEQTFHVLLTIHTHIYIYVSVSVCAWRTFGKGIKGRERANGFSGCSIPANEAVLQPHFLKIVVEMKASLHFYFHHFFQTVVGGKKWHAACKMSSLQQIIFLCH